MSFIVATLKRLTICPCGENVLFEAIQRGTRYRIDPATLRTDFDYQCGRCKTTQHGVAVVRAFAVLNPTPEPGWIPADLFGTRQPNGEYDFTLEARP